LYAGYSAIETSEEYKQIFGWNNYPVKKINVPQKTLNEVIEKEIPNVKKIDIISLDIEGGEYICLPSMVKWFKTRKPKLLLSLHPGFLIKKSNKFISAKYIIRFLRQLELFKSLRIFPYIYDVGLSKQISPLALFRFKFLRGKEGKDLQVLCSFVELTL
jgi:hypothetical protein